MEGWRKAIPESRDRLQSRVLVSLMGLMLVAFSAGIAGTSIGHAHAQSLSLVAGIISLTFGLAVWALRAATPLAALMGGLICFIDTVLTAALGGQPQLHSALTPLMALFVLTFAAGRIGRRQKASRSVGSDEDAEEAKESRHGRAAAQIVANLGGSSLILFIMFFVTFVPVDSFDRVGKSPVEIEKILLLAALAEATADTLSSELGSAFGGVPFLLTSFRRVKPGTDGAISLFGTLAGALGAALVVLAGAWAMQLSLRASVAAFAGAIAGLFFDSLLGATVERRGWLGNDWVNFLSTVFAACVALAMI